MVIAYIVEPLSACDIELDSAIFLKKYQPEVLEGKRPLDVEKLLDNIYEDKEFSLQLVKEDELPKGVLGISEMDNKVIKIPEADFLKCDSGGYQRMTITHEVAHPRLHFSQFEKNSMQLFRTQGNYIPPFKSSEWQANVWASATLMPFESITKLIGGNFNINDGELIEAVIKKFIVSKEAAKVRIETIEKYYIDGRYKKIEDSLKKEGILLIE